MTVLSLFDGMSCGQLALQRADIGYDTYYASEVDKWAIKVTQHHFPGTVQLGDVRDVHGTDLPKIDLLIGGSPCKGFSRAGSGLNFEHPESKLFFEYVRILKVVKPKYWLLENVKMKKKWEIEINKILGRKPLRFNSSWVSAQHRERLYWTNIPINQVPADKKIGLADIVEYDLAEGESASILQRGRGFNKGGIINGGKSTTLSSNSWQHKNFIVTHSLQKRMGKGQGGKGPLKKVDGKSYCLDTANGQAIEFEGQKRKLTVKECCRLQTVPDNYFDGLVSNTQAYKMLGNGWTVDMIAFIFSFMRP